jgi:murein DD-endopeptidase MepM/ murein hydrolase activator NlpD
VKEVDMLYGIDYTDMSLIEGEVGSGELLGTLLGKFGLGASDIHRVEQASKGVFDVRRFKAGQPYTAFVSADSLAQLKYLVYEDNVTDYVVFAFAGDSVKVNKEHKDVIIKRVKTTATITSSLWNSMIDAGVSPKIAPALTMNLSEEIYAWTIDFFGLREGDHFTVIYDEKFVDTLSVGIGRIWGAEFNHAGKDFYAIPFNQDGKVTYWDENGNSLRKSMLKAPLKYSRISSRFSNSRLHPVLKIRRAHHGVDYAAPSGTPVHAVANGTIIFKGWGGGGGNTIKIKHNSNLTTGYLHLRGFAKGIAVGKHVNQGDLIGYVGSTGTSTGPHLDYRVWRGGKAIDPLKITSEPAAPIAKKNRADFDLIKKLVLDELAGNVPDSLKVTQLDSLAAYRPHKPAPAPAADSLKK